MAKTEITPENFDPNNMDHVMTVLKECVTHYKDVINKYKDEDLLQADMEGILALTQICHEIASLGLSVLIADPNMDEEEIDEALFFEYEIDDFKLGIDTQKDVKKLKIVTDVVPSTGFDEDGLLRDELRQALFALYDRLEKMIAHEDLFNQKMRRFFQATMDLVENLEDRYQAEQHEMMEELCQKYPNCRGARIYIEANEDEDYDEDEYDEDEDLDDEDWDEDDGDVILSDEDFEEVDEDDDEDDEEEEPQDSDHVLKYKEQSKQVPVVHLSVDYFFL